MVLAGKPIGLVSALGTVGPLRHLAFSVGFLGTVVHGAEPNLTQGEISSLAGIRELIA